MSRRHWPAALALLSSLILGSYLLYTERLMREIRAEAAQHMRMYAQVQRGLLSLDPGAELRSLLSLQQSLAELGVPIVAVTAEGEPYAAVNLPFRADLRNAVHRERVRAYIAELDRQNPPISEEGAGTIHFGAPPILSRLRWVPWLQVGGALLLLFVALGLVRAAERAERERMWAAMARELAHQMGTPLSSLAGWLEVLRLPRSERDALATPERIAEEIAADLDRLKRVSRRFELIGKPPELEAVTAGSIVEELQAYLRPRLPRLAAGVQLQMRVKRGLPEVAANRVLLVWALENLVKNALDALAGRGGRIVVAATRARDERVRIFVADNGPGIDPAVRERLFEPGASTKAGGWGVGLSLTRRIVEELHRGRISVRARRGGGTVFEMVIPSARERFSGRRVLGR
ncbi:MAG: HAMP domain-containing histidine kinase [Gemmatimonadetes bacterium]|nr:HAMP domain-containing histidine kinase [Gemmatimonadota bacterium]